ncbi:hypothetical protein ACJX0J_002582, partial (mitochondrion) [Zea mays]
LILLVAMIGAIQSLVEAGTTPRELVVSEWLHSFRIRSCGALRVDRIKVTVSKRMSNRTSQIVIVQYERWWCLDARKKLVLPNAHKTTVGEEDDCLEEDLLLLHPPNDAQEMTIQILDKLFRNSSLSEAQQSFNRSLPYRELMDHLKELQELGASPHEMLFFTFRYYSLLRSTVSSTVYFDFVQGVALLPLMFTVGNGCQRLVTAWFTEGKEERDTEADSLI